MVKINFSNRVAYTFIVLGIFVAIAIGVNAYNTNPTSGTPSTMGHSRGELNLSPIYFSGNSVGIGATPDPSYALDVNGNIIASGGLSTPGIIFFGGNPALANCPYLKTSPIGGGGVIGCASGSPSGGLTATGTPTTNRIATFTGASSLGDSLISQNPVGVNKWVIFDGDTGLILNDVTGGKGQAYIYTEPTLTLAGNDNTIDIWKSGAGNGYGKINVGSIRLNSGTGAYENATISSSGDVIIQLG